MRHGVGGGGGGVGGSGGENGDLYWVVVVGGKRGRCGSVGKV